jgi:hypothetical protein
VNADDTKSPAGFSGAQERKIVLLLCCLAAVHVFIFSAAFPFFNNVDEIAQFDLAVKYSQGHVPRRLELLSTDSTPYLALYSSGMYFGTPEMFPDGKFPTPPWKQPVEKIRQTLLANEAAWRTVTNYESSQPPLYYALEGCWWRAGQWLGFENGWRLYWLRFLNIFIVAALVWLGCRAARLIFPENPFLRLAIPAVIAFFPQTAFYSIENDALLPLCFGAAFICLLQFLRAEIPDARLAVATGLALAAAFLTKMTSLPLLAVSAIFIALKIFQMAGEKKLRAALPALAALVFCAALPMACWMTWCKLHFGDFTGSAAKAGYFGWTHKPFAEWWPHPIFTLRGFSVFMPSLIATFWQSEFLWHGRPLSLPAVDWVYIVLSVGGVGMALLKFPKMPRPQRRALWLAFWSVAASVAFVGFLSIIFDFGDDHNPSRARPYFTAGRLILGALIPFLLLILYGLDCALGRLKNSRARPLALGVLILFMLLSEIAVDWPVFSNEYNWFHL